MVTLHRRYPADDTYRALVLVNSKFLKTPVQGWSGGRAQAIVPYAVTHRQSAGNLGITT
jgi:hypothetical protein